MLEIVRYNPEFKNLWDNLITNSRNGTFLFYRDYMDYHSDKYKDCSFLILNKGKVESVIPGNINNKTFLSHQGLTYGGLIMSDKINVKSVLEIFSLLNRILRSLGLEEVIYKPIPIIYHRIPSQEDIYALFRNKAEKVGCNISSTIFQNNKPSFTESRKSGIRKSIREGVKILESSDFSSFWNILETNLTDKFKTNPVHSKKEIELLQSRFPENLKLYEAKYSGEVVGGTVLYIMNNIVHVQYISANDTGKKIGALDLLFDELINREYQDIPVFDFGQSTEKSGSYLNETLIFQKEGFGGRGIVYETYKYSLI